MNSARLAATAALVLLSGCGNLEPGTTEVELDVGRPPYLTDASADSVTIVPFTIANVGGTMIALPRCGVSFLVGSQRWEDEAWHDPPPIHCHSSETLLTVRLMPGRFLADRVLIGRSGRYRLRLDFREPGGEWRSIHSDPFTLEPQADSAVFD